MAAPASLSCASCGVGYPHVGGIPWLFREPALVLGEWQNRLTLYLEEFRLEARRVRADLAAGPTSAAQIARLRQLLAGYDGQVECVTRLLAPLGLAERPAAHAAMTAFDARVPRHQDLHSYYVNLHRDWAWGVEENQQSAALVLQAIPDLPGGRLLVLGAGGARLAYDLHASGRFAHVVALDINPLLLLCAGELLAGRAVELYEFPIAPRTSADHAIRRRLPPPPPPAPGLTLVFGDALAPPFAAGAFDVVVTPWLCDIVDDPLAALAARVNRLLREQGTWVNFGSASFTGLRPRDRLGIDEVCETVEAGGFVLRHRTEQEIPYMRSPASRHSRREVVIVHGACRVADAAEPPPPALLPPWLRDPRVPIPVSESIEATALASRLQAVALALIDGTRSAADVAGFLVQQQLLGPEAALAAVRGLLLRLHESARRVPPAP